MARIYEVFPLPCTICGWQMRIIAFITYSADIRHTGIHRGRVGAITHIPGTWAAADAQAGEGVEPAPDRDEECQVAPDFEVDHRISWQGKATAVCPTLRGRVAPATTKKMLKLKNLGQLAQSKHPSRPHA